MSEHPGPPTLSLALSSVVGAAVDGGDRAGLLHLVRPGTASPQGGPGVVPFPAPRRPLDDDPSAA